MFGKQIKSYAAIGLQRKQESQTSLIQVEEITIELNKETIILWGRRKLKQLYLVLGREETKE